MAGEEGPCGDKKGIISVKIKEHGIPKMAYFWHFISCTYVLKFQYNLTILKSAFYTQHNS